MTDRTPRSRSAPLLAAILLTVASLAFSASVEAAVKAPTAAPAQRAQVSEQGGSSLEDAAAKAGNTGRAVAMSLIGLALAVAATVLAFRRDFKEAAGVFAVGLVAVLLATPAGVSLLRDTVASLFGSQ
ncbi:MAG TPA: hypothetical protein VH061_03150 [Solirubrobacteraceae bacterium]|jgi:hypothetical protein|nr:hypothetical protein [Solirubrobacteraceae bacterium]